MLSNSLPFNIYLLFTSLKQLLKRPTLNFITQITVEEFVAGTKFLLDEKKVGIIPAVQLFI